MKWSSQQADALTAVHAWHTTGDSQIMRVFGFAGTGKTTLAMHFASQINGTTEYAAFTGKAAMVMKRNGCAGAGTIHSKMYKAKRNKRTQNMEFKFNRNGPFSTASLIVIDECSMVDAELAEDLLKYKVKILVLGDPAQLPPVKGGGYFTEAEPDVMLTDIHRQAKESPIIAMATDVREGRILQHGTYGTSEVIKKTDICKGRILAADQVLVGLNKSRAQYNARIRSLKSIKGWRPVDGERLVCLKNNKMLRIFNGGIFTIKRIHDETTFDRADRVIRLDLKSEDMEGREVSTSVRREMFEGGHEDLHWREFIQTDKFDFAYALTVHKSQGSQWSDVVLFNESGAFREDARRWLYTGITRAAETVTVVQ